MLKIPTLNSCKNQDCVYSVPKQQIRKSVVETGNSQNNRIFEAPYFIYQYPCYRNIKGVQQCFIKGGTRETFEK